MVTTGTTLSNKESLEKAKRRIEREKDGKDSF